MPVVVARGMRPSLRLVEADAEADETLLAAIADWCRRFTPLAALDPPDGIILDVSGVAHLFGGGEGLLKSVEAALAGQGFARRVALAPHAGAATAFARFGGPRFVESLAALEKAVRALPVAALRLDDKTTLRLRDAGLRSLGDLLLRPRAPIAARFGAIVFARIDAMLGLRRDPLSPRFEAPPYMVERRFADGLTRREVIATTLEALCEDLAVMLARHEEGVRCVLASFFRVDGIVQHLEVATSRPSRDASMILRLFVERLERIGEEGLDTGYGFDVIRVAALSVEPLPGEQSGLRGTLSQAQDRPEDFADLIDRLGARFGTQRVQRLDFIDTHWPEAAVVARPAARGRPDLTALQAVPLENPFLPTRPLRLFEKPEPINAIATVPDGPPERFTWRRVTHDVIAVEGPERIASEWWKDQAPTRDYFRVEDSQGGRFWLFREGLYGAETMDPRWFMHGLFG